MKYTELVVFLEGEKEEASRSNQSVRLQLAYLLTLAFIRNASEDLLTSLAAHSHPELEQSVGQISSRSRNCV